MTYAFWRRWIIIDFPNQFPEDKTFYERNFTEETIRKLIIIGILAFKNVLKNNKFTGEENDIMDRWLKETNRVYAFIKDMQEIGIQDNTILIKLIKDKDAKTEQNEIYNLYVDYCNKNDYETKNKREFTIEMEKLGFPIARYGTGMKFYKGIKIVRNTEENNNLGY